MNKIDDPKKQAAIALKKAQTSITRILKMIEDDEYCIDIMEQILAVNGLIKSSSEKMLQNHLRTCFKTGMETADDAHKEQLISEVVEVLNLSKKGR